MMTSPAGKPELPITSNAFDPGSMAGTGVGRYGKGLMRLAWYTFLPLASRLFKFGRTTAQSGVTGRYFSGREQVASSSESYDLDNAADLWRASVELAGLQPGESPLAGMATRNGSNESMQ